jgi:hypothetical protein
MCVEVYLDILPAAKRTFINPTRLAHSVIVTALRRALRVLPVPLQRILVPEPWSGASHGLNQTSTTLPHPSWSVATGITTTTTAPGLNLSFVLDGIMNETHGLRPLDMTAFARNNVHQPLRVVTTSVDPHNNGTLVSTCFGPAHYLTSSPHCVHRADGKRSGLDACLEASMMVPGAAGDPVRLVVPNDKMQHSTLGHSTLDPATTARAYYDAFCMEPLPYRSAVAEGATHVLVLCSRPDGYQPKTKPGVYERGVANWYFEAHGEAQLATFFANGGQQYIYAEDLLTLDLGKQAGLGPSRIRNGVGEMAVPSDDRDAAHGVAIPPPHVLYGVESRNARAEYLATHRDEWQRAHICPVQVPAECQELSTMAQERDAVGTAIREGFAAAFDLLAPVAGVSLPDGLTGTDVAHLVFPLDAKLDEKVLEQQLRIKGDCIPFNAEEEDLTCRVPQHEPSKSDKCIGGIGLKSLQPQPQTCQVRETRRRHAEHLLNVLPGFACGRMAHLAARLRTCMV